MTTHPDYLALLATICAAPEDDAPRLVLADWLDIDGPPACRDPKRAEFIRVQVRLAELERVREKQPNLRMEGMELFGYRTAVHGELKALAAMLDDSTIHDLDCELCLDRRSTELYARHRQNCFPVEAGNLTLGMHRGFARLAHGPAADWLAHGDALSWSPEQTVEVKCTANRDPKLDLDNSLWYEFHRYCNRCSGTGVIRVPRRCPPTAQPVTEVRLTTRIGFVDGIGDPVPDASDAERLSSLRLRWPAVRTWHLPAEPEIHTQAAAFDRELAGLPRSRRRTTLRINGGPPLEVVGMSTNVDEAEHVVETADGRTHRLRPGDGSWELEAGVDVDEIRRAYPQYDFTPRFPVR